MSKRGRTTFNFDAPEPYHYEASETIAPKSKWQAKRSVEVNNKSAKYHGEPVPIPNSNYYWLWNRETKQYDKIICEPNGHKTSYDRCPHVNATCPKAQCERFGKCLAMGTKKLPVKSRLEPLLDANQIALLREEARLEQQKRLGDVGNALIDAAKRKLEYVPFKKLAFKFK